MGFHGWLPDAGVIWQHIHYIVGLRARMRCITLVVPRAPYNPDTFEVNNEFDYAAKILERLATEFDFKRRGASARAISWHLTAGLPLKRLRELYRAADAILNVCGAQEFNEDLLVPAAFSTSKAIPAWSRSRSISA